MGREFSRLTVPDEGEAVRYADGEFRSPEAPLVPVVHGADDALVSAVRRIADAAAAKMGREIHWVRVDPDGTDDWSSEGVPRDVVWAFRTFRVGVVGPLADDRGDALQVEADLRRRVGLHLGVSRHANLEWLPTPVRAGDDRDVTVFRDVTEDAAAGLEYDSEERDADALREFLLDTAADDARVPEEPAAFGVRPHSADAAETLVDAAMEYALSNDRRTLTVVHQGDLLEASEGAFREWALDYLDAEYGDATIGEATHREEYAAGAYPSDEVVVRDRRTDEVLRDLVSRPGDYDVLLAPALGGRYVASVAAETAGGTGDPVEVFTGDGRLLALAQPTESRREETTNPISLLTATGVLWNTLGWADVATVVETAVERTLADGLLPRELYRRSARGHPVTAAEFATAVIDRLDARESEVGAGGVRTSVGERAAMKRAIAGLYSIVFEDSLDPADIELNQLFGADEEADIYLPEVGLNFTYWREWSVERKLEVLVHELAHVDEEPGERDHGPEFYARFADLLETIEDWQPEVEALFDAPVDFGLVHRFVVESVFEETIEPDLESVEERKAWLRDRLGVTPDDHY